VPMLRGCWLVPILASMLAGCLPSTGTLEKSTISLVPTNPVNTPVAANSSKVTLASGSSEVAMKVDLVGHKILAANQDAKIQPYFATIGSTQPELFHQGDKLVYVTEGLVKKCKTEGQLAAVLSEELAAMEAERRTLARLHTRDAEQNLPITVPVGNAGQFNAPDLTNLAELSKADKARTRAAQRPTPIDPQALARKFLKNAHYADGDYDAARPLLKEAEANCALEKQINGSARLSSHGTPPPIPQPALAETPARRLD
jgi:predicted Zn-dependent protease